MSTRPPEDKPGRAAEPPPRQVTYAALAVMLGSIALVVSAFAEVATLHTLATRTAVERLIARHPNALGVTVDGWLTALKAAAMVCAACATAAVILGWQTLQRSHAARVVLLVLVGPLVVTGFATGPIFALVVGFAVVVLWLPSANSWFQGRPAVRMLPMSDAPPPPPGSSGPQDSPYGSPPPVHGQQPPPPYAQQPYASPYAPPQPHPFPPYAGLPGDPDARPGVVTAAAIVTFVLAGITALLGLLLAVLGASTADDLLRRLSDHGYDTRGVTAHDLAVGLGVVGALFAVAAVAAIVTAALVLRRSGPARVVLTVLSGLTIALSLVGIGSVVSVVTLAGAIAVIVLLYQRRANDWFARRGPQQGFPPYPGAPLTGR